MNYYDVIAGLISGILLAFLGYLINTYTKPFIQKLLTTIIDLEGEWYCRVINPSGNIQDITFSIMQRGDKIRGKMIIIKHIKTTEKTEVKEFTVKGEIRNKFVILYAHNSQKQSMGSHTALLEILDGNTMKGMGLWNSITERIIRSNEFEWHRVGEEIKKKGYNL